jgi:hypothetical protein
MSKVKGAATSPTARMAIKPSREEMAAKSTRLLEARSPC